ncbi:MAG: restriction endonuclease subunit S [Candidatus Bathyarchaeota archaeon]|nr:restriction endonuclease subunit S [Candidatus Termiticorpusculum sp.]
MPKVRFKGFTKDWEARKLDDIAIFRRGSFPQPYGNPEWYDKDQGMPFVQVVDVNDDLHLVNDTKQKISKKAQPKSVFVPVGKVIVTLQGSIGRVAITQYPAYVDRTILIFEEYQMKINVIYWAYIIQEKFNIEKRTAPGGTIKTITKEVLSDFEVVLPSFEEQTAISNFLRNIDEQITTQKVKLENLKLLKTAYLQKIFV